MPLIPTAEIRWFVEGALPDAATRWLAAVAPAPLAEEPRTDRYVRTAAEDLGVKVREGRLETKRRTGVLGPEQFAGCVEGRIETWEKWSFGLAASARPAAWVAVRKKRWLVKFRVQGERLTRVERVGLRAHGVNVELAVVKVGGRAWWSVCLESFGPGAAARLDALRRVAAHVFVVGAPPVLPAERAMGYPAWLAREVRT